MTNPQATVVVLNATFPHLQEYAVELANAGLLERYIHAFALSPVTVARIDNLAFGPAKRLSSQFKLRTLPAALTKVPVHLPAAPAELAGLMLAKLGKPQNQRQFQLRRRLLRHRNAVLSASAIPYLTEANTLFASYSTGYLAFRRANSLGTQAVLDYPTAHHHFASHLWDQQVALWPEWADTWPYISDPALMAILDEECERSDAIIVGSQFAADTFDTALRPKVHVCNYSVRSFAFTETARRVSPDTDRLELLFVGQLSLRKGLPYLFQAMSQLTEENVHCTIVGPYIGSRQWLSSVPTNVTLVGPVARTELAQYYQRSSVLLVPSLLEGLPNVVLEALSFGLPVITTATGGDQVISNGVNGFVIPPGDVTQLTNSILRLLEIGVLDELRSSTVLRQPANSRSDGTIVKVLSDLRVNA